MLEIKKQKIKIYKYLYDNKSGKAKNKNEGKDIIVINNEDIDNLVKKIYYKYEKNKKIRKYKIEDIICTCSGDFHKICDLLENKIG